MPPRGGGRRGGSPASGVLPSTTAATAPRRDAGRERSSIAYATNPLEPCSPPRQHIPLKYEGASRTKKRAGAVLRAGNYDTTSYALIRALAVRVQLGATVRQGDRGTEESQDLEHEGNEALHSGLLKEPGAWPPWHSCRLLLPLSVTSEEKALTGGTRAPPPTPQLRQERTIWAGPSRNSDWALPPGSATPGLSTGLGHSPGRLSPLLRVEMTACRSSVDALRRQSPTAYRLRRQAGVGSVRAALTDARRPQSSTARTRRSPSRRISAWVRRSLKALTRRASASSA